MINYLPPIPCESKDCSGVIFTDWHFPAHGIKATEELKQLVKSIKPNFIFNLGDVFDNKSASRFDKEKLFYIAVHERAKTLPEVWNDGIAEHDEILKYGAKGCKNVVLFGNHDIRIIELLKPLVHLTGVEYNPFLFAWKKSKFKIDIYDNYPNNDVLFESVTGIKTEVPIILSHAGSGTNGNHAKKTWTKYSKLLGGCSVIYGHAHDPNFWYGAFNINAMTRDNRFAFCIGAMMDRSNEFYAGYCGKAPRDEWTPTALTFKVIKNVLYFEEHRFTAEPLPFHQPKQSQLLEVY